MKPTILLDLSRLLWSAKHKTPSGIERVELVYALHLLRSGEERVHFAATTPWHSLALLPKATAIQFVLALDQLWRGGHPQSAAQVSITARRLKRSLVPGAELALSSKVNRIKSPMIYLLLSHHHLDRPELIERIKTRTEALFIAFLHDLIPLQFPEYGRPGEAKRHESRMKTVARLADGIIHNSTSTSSAFQPFLTEAGRKIPSVVAHLGVHFSPASRIPAEQNAATFIYLGTIEPRKNHLLLLNLWRRFASMEINPMPRLILIGRRGWENENIIDMLDRCRAIRPYIDEHSDLADDDVIPLLARACALLLPSFAEGYGLPLAEALALGVPVICSDIPALREVGGDVPEYLDPLDGLGWQTAILDYARPGSPRRQAQLNRLAGWTSPQWETHLAFANELIEQVFRERSS